MSQTDSKINPSLADTTDGELGSLRVATTPKLEIVQSDDQDLNDLRIDPSLLEGVAAKVPLTIGVRKPPKQEFIRVHPEPAFRLTVGAIDLKEEGEFYVVKGSMGEQLLGTEAAIY